MCSGFEPKLLIMLLMFVLHGSGKYVDLTCLVQVCYVFLLSFDISSSAYETKWPASYSVFCM
jgi:hypothetical protein